jgi:hypothetical protein
MSITVQVDLPDSVAAEAKARGLFEPQRMADMIARELAGSDPRTFFEIVREIQENSGMAMSADEVQAEVEAVRASRRQGETGC